MKSNTESNQSWKATIQSPIPAVNVNTPSNPISRAPSNCKNILNNNLIGPATIVNAISNKANSPLKVLLNLSAASSLTVKYVVNLWKAAIKLNNPSAIPSTGKISTQASLIAPNTATRP